MLSKRDQILSALESFASQRPGIEPGNYGDWQSYRSESRSVTRDLHDAHALIGACCRYPSLVTEEILRESFRAYSGRLKLSDCENGSVSLDYCTGQYFPTEYRKAVCSVLGSALFQAMRENLLRVSAERFQRDGVVTEVAGDSIRKGVRNLIGARLQRRWVD